MKYGETLFDIVYLLFVIISGILILKKGNKLAGISALTLGIGDAFHLVPRCLNYFVDKDFTMYLGIGKLVTSITMTIFYLLIYYLLKKHNKNITNILWILVIIRIIFCFLPGNKWLTDNSTYLMGIIRNIPFFIIGALMVYLFYRDKKYKNVWLLILLSFIFYAVVVFGADYYKMLGMFMIPKTICYMIMVNIFRKKAN